MGWCWGPSTQILHKGSGDAIHITEGHLAAGDADAVSDALRCGGGVNVGALHAGTAD